MDGFELPVPKNQRPLCSLLETLLLSQEYVKQADFLNQPVTLFLGLNQRYRNYHSERLGSPAEALIEVEDS